MNIEILIMKLLSYYQIKTLNDLAIKLDTTQSTISGWKARNAIGALTDTVANKDPEALEFIFSSNSNVYNLQNSTNRTVLDKSSNKEDNTNTYYGNDLDIDKNILKLVDTVYSFAKENRLEELKTDLILLLQKYSSKD
ncbi:hypothetical protein ACN9J6_05745 [Aliarcobacter butzleri]|uniref:hypothetical protein n=1 Tax=Aliarcobacter butzleri TaxID=28197 RepID=UPI003B21788A